MSLLSISYQIRQYIKTWWKWIDLWDIFHIRFSTENPPPIYFACGSYNRKIFTCGAIKHTSVLLLLVPHTKFCDQRKSKNDFVLRIPLPQIPQWGGGFSLPRMQIKVHKIYTFHTCKLDNFFFFLAVGIISYTHLMLGWLLFILKVDIDLLFDLYIEICWYKDKFLIDYINDKTP